ncbi:unnamed protein product [Durusdinium trenchii]|uniref:Calcineurin-like phosphoesterase domain-containing protein n=2 Tax=Durusdinium trenchii TaxID=1381693 RepID=A0ABP0IMW4_9DINO
MCVETCTVLHSKEAQKAQVWRSSGSKSCELKEVRLQETAMNFVQPLEHDALKLMNGMYRNLPILEKWKVTRFLSKVTEEVLMPEFQSAEGHGYSREIPKEVQYLVIIGDLHGQLFNLIAYLVRIMETYTGQGLNPLDGSSLLLRDPRIQYVFLGDYVDRGERGLELS